jgi:hypothetical protein
MMIIIKHQNKTYQTLISSLYLAKEPENMLTISDLANKRYFEIKSQS